MAIANTIRIPARWLGKATARFPALNRVMRSVFLSLPASIRGEQMIYDHFESIVRSGARPFFLQVGANDGVCNDPLFQFVKKHGWRGIVVEPVPEYFEQLQKNYRGCDVICENVAVSEEFETRDFYFLSDPGGGLPGWAKGVGSFSREQVLSHRDDVPDLDRFLKTAEIDCVPLAHVLEKNAVKNVELLVVDTEGYDANILAQVDFDLIKPRTIIFEHKLMNEAERKECLERLEAAGYTCRRDAYDVLAMLP